MHAFDEAGDEPQVSTSDDALNTRGERSSRSTVGQSDENWG